MPILRRRSPRTSGPIEQGASLIEFALIMPLILVLVLGVVEFGYLFGEYNEIRHGAHEGTRLAAVNDTSLLNKTCDSIALNGGTVSIDFTDSATGSVGEQASVTVTATISSLSGFGLIEAFLPAELETTAAFKLEQPSSSWDNGSDDGTC